MRKRLPLGRQEALALGDDESPDPLCTCHHDYCLPQTRTRTRPRPRPRGLNPVAIRIESTPLCRPSAELPHRLTGSQRRAGQVRRGLWPLCSGQPLTVAASHCRSAFLPFAPINAHLTRPHIYGFENIRRIIKSRSRFLPPPLPKEGRCPHTP